MEDKISRSASKIWDSFYKSGKRHLMITGARGSGKTTLLNILFPKKLPGITTWAAKKEAVYLRENITNETAKVGIFDPTLQKAENRMVLLNDGFNTLGVPAIKRAIDSESPWVSIDEIGYLEAKSEIYHEAIRMLLNKKQVAAVIRKQDLPFLNELLNRDDVFLIDTDKLI